MGMELLRWAQVELERELGAVNAALNTLAVDVGVREKSLVVHGGLKGLAIPDAIQAVLSRYSVPLDLGDVINGLETGGVYLGLDPNRRVRNVRSALGNVRHRFHYDRQKDTVALRSS